MELITKITRIVWYLPLQIGFHQCHVPGNGKYTCNVQALLRVTRLIDRKMEFFPYYACNFQ